MGARPAGRGMSRLVKRSFSLAGHRTSVALEQEFWEALAGMAGRADEAVSALVARIDAGRDAGTPLASALRVATLRAIQAAAPDRDKRPCHPTSVEPTPRRD